MASKIKAWLFSVCTLFSSVFAACPFCDPVVLKNQMVYENSLYWILADRAPVIKGHLLVIPKRHVARADEMTEAEWSNLYQVVPKVVAVFQKALTTNQYLLLEKNGPFAGQTVPHVHFHMIPIQTEMKSDAAKAALFAKMFGILPTRLTAEEMKNEVMFFRGYFNP